MEIRVDCPYCSAALNVPLQVGTPVREDGQVSLPISIDREQLDELISEHECGVAPC